MRNTPRRFVLLTGLKHAFSKTGFPSSTAMIADVSTKCNGNSVIFITCTAEDAAEFGVQYAEGTQWIWAKDRIYAASDTAAILKNVTLVDSSVQVGDSIEVALGKLQAQVDKAQKSGGVTGVMGSGDNYIDVEPTSPATGLVDISVSHKLITRADNTASENIVFQFNAISDVSTDGAGHVLGQTVKKYVLPVEQTLTDSSDKLPSSHAVKIAIDQKVLNAAHYLGTVESQAEVVSKSLAQYGDFVRAKADFSFADTSVHTSDMIILDSSAAGAYASAANWTVLHNERDSWREIKYNGTQLLASTDPTALDISAGKFVTLDEVGGKLVIGTSIDNASTAHRGIVQLADVITYTDPVDPTKVVIDSSDPEKAVTALGVYRLYNEIIDFEEVTSQAINNLDASIKAMDYVDSLEANKYVVAVSQVDGKINVTKAELQITHQTSKNVIGDSSSATVDASASNGNVWLNHTENNTVTSYHKFVGANNIEVTSNANTKEVIVSVKDATENTTGIVKISDSSTSRDSSTAASTVALSELRDEVIRDEEVVSAAINDLYECIHEASADDWAIIGA